MPTDQVLFKVVMLALSMIIYFGWRWNWNPPARTLRYWLEWVPTYIAVCVIINFAEKVIYY